MKQEIKKLSKKKMIMLEKEMKKVLLLNKTGSTAHSDFDYGSGLCVHGVGTCGPRRN